MTVICDYLTVTCHPESSFVNKVYSWCCQNFPLAFEAERDGQVYKAHFDVQGGAILMEECSRFHIVRASGAALEVLRDEQLFDSYLSLLSEVPHKVTRLDAAYDVDIDAPLILRELESRYPYDKVQLTRKALTVTRVYSTRADKQLSGTWYAGQKTKARVTARVYDKQKEAFDKRGVILPPRTRYELQFGKDLGCTLRDARMPASLFYQFASPVLLDKPDDVPDWNPHGDGWQADAIDTDVTVARYRKRVESSPEVKALARMAAELGPGGEAIASRIFLAEFHKALDAAQDSPQVTAKAGGV